MSMKELPLSEAGKLSPRRYSNYTFTASPRTNKADNSFVANNKNNTKNNGKQAINNTNGGRI
jgi:hypothetical protein